MPGSSGAVNNQTSRNRTVSVCQVLHLTEENIRFILLAIILYIYLCLGAFIFQAFEEEAEAEMRRNYTALYEEFRYNLTILNDEATFNSRAHVSNYVGGDFQITEEDLLRLLYAYGNASKAGAFLRQRWDWVGSFHFAWTIVSTIGYGATTPTTIPGQLLIIPYGFLGCAGGLLFFNLFLERIITFLASCMRCYRLLRQRRQTSESAQPQIQTEGSLGRDYLNGGQLGVPSSGRRSSQSSVACNTPVTDEKPSVTWVMVCLSIMSSIIIFASAGLYHFAEGWTFIESIYFAFISYTTIGLGDFVTFQKISYGNLEILYRIVAFGVIVIGCCCIYSLLNVTSIVIKRFLNWIIRALDCPCCVCCRCLNRRIQRGLSRRRTQQYRQKYGGAGVGNYRGRASSMQVAVVRVTSGNDSGHHCSIDMDEHERRYSGENLVSLRSELSSKVSMAVLQKRLYEQTQMNRFPHSDMPSDFSVRNVGPLAIVSEKFGDTTT